MSRVDILSKFHKKRGPYKRVGWEIRYDMSKYRVGGKSKNDNRVDSFFWHLGVGVFYGWSLIIFRGIISLNINRNHIDVAFYQSSPSYNNVDF